MRRKKTNSIFLTLIICCGILLAALLPCASFASVDTGKDSSVSIDYISDGITLSGAKLALYHIASVDEDRNITIDDIYSTYNITFNPGDENALFESAETLSGYITRDNLAPLETKTVPDDGKVIFDALRPGLYLILAEGIEKDGFVYTSAPILVGIPVFENGSYIYDINAAPKIEKTEKEKEPTEISVVKIWKDDGKNRPEKIEVQLLCEGEVRDTVTLGSDNNWRHTWKNLDAGFKWQVVEKSVPAGYTVSTNTEGNTVFLTNTKPTVPEKPTGPLPQTGQIWLPVIALFACGILFVIIGAVLVRKQKREKEK